MKQTLIVTSSNRHMESNTRDGIDICCHLGARWVRQTLSADVAFARCRALTMAAQLIMKAERPVDVVLMIDDDIDFDARRAQRLVDECRARNRPCSGVYATLSGTPAAAPFRSTGKHHTWLVGLGFLTIPALEVLRLYDESPEFAYLSSSNGKVHRQLFREFTWSGARDGVWKAEDYNLCERLGGVDLLPIEVGHLKTIPLGPSKSVIDQLKKADDERNDP